MSLVNSNAKVGITFLSANQPWLGLAAVVRCGFLCERLILLGSERISLDFKYFPCLNTFPLKQKKIERCGFARKQFFLCGFRVFNSLSFQGFLGGINASEWWVGLSVRFAFNSSKKQFLSAVGLLSLVAIRVGNVCRWDWASEKNCFKVVESPSARSFHQLSRNSVGSSFKACNSV